MCKDNTIKKKGLEWKYLRRQLFVNSGVWTSNFLLGLSVGAPTVLVPQLNKENKSETISIEQVSWLTGNFVYSGVPWVILLPLISAYFGRKIGFLIVCISTMIGYIVFYCSFDVKQIIISEMFHGVLTASNLTMLVIISTEYSSSKYRGIFLTIKPASFYWGVLVSNSIGTFFHWRNIPLLGMICASYCLLTIYFWPESPLWLAKKGYFDKCVKTHRWLKGSSDQLERDLEKILTNNQHVKKTSIKAEAVGVFRSIRKKHFYKAMLLCILLKYLATFSGKFIFTMYALNILKKVSANTSRAYTSMLILDSVSVISTYVGCGLSKIYRRRVLLITLTSITAFFLYSLSLYLYLIKLAILSENVYVTLSLFIGFSIATSCGPTILCESMAGELLPIESRTVALCIYGLSYIINTGAFIKIAPYIFQNLGMHGTFVFFAICLSICLILVYIYVPETKDKTLQEISDIVGGKESVIEAQELLPIISNRPDIANINNT